MGVFEDIKKVLSQFIVPSQNEVPDYYSKSAKKQLDIRTFVPFGALAEKVLADKRTYLYYDRLYSIFQSLLNLKQIYKPGISIAEVGVFKGGGSFFMASVLEKLGMADVELHSFDTFEGHDIKDISVENDNTRIHVPAKFSETSLESVREYLRTFKMVKLYKGRFQDNAEQVRKGTFGFVHIDVDLYEPTLYSLEFFDERLVIGGIIIIDDFDCTTCLGVRTAVEEFLDSRSNYAMYALLSAQCILVKCS